jgi:hypothetical protein
MSKQLKYSDTGANGSVDLQSFTKALVANLVNLDVDAIHPHNPKDRKGFENVVRVLDAVVKKLMKENASSDVVLAVARIANELRPSNTGSYEGFEAALRSLQLTFTASPNPFYDDIAFPVSKVQAQSFTNKIPAFQRSLATSAAKAFVAARK